ncbi:YbhB/YbcL family Raf kinase inhibitor-like protein [Celeribacter indicus]|uniref:PEBP family protein n=1 Tax=Celeribacter indicus TaxID=1208324 RepID=A0A0B5DUM1_9RHOB|nr:YbhB/YbcL family Raf kinase inhibitor-like protein [Celeribacter indicus]AJE47118.1 PEBP family protein [Celeribacter indicus]SDW90385.1 Raf kinase inhibitor-like protein, YbhB/YbcL family [Celeribacter indicus]
MPIPMSSARAGAALLTTALAGAALAQPQGEVGEYSDATISNSVLQPEPITVSDDSELASLIRVPEGFEVSVAARDLGNTRILAVHDSGTVYATRRSESDVIRLIDEDGDGRFEAHETVAARPGLHGIALDGDTAYLVTVTDVYTAPVNEDGSFGTLERIIDDLPEGGQHPNRMVAVGPDGMLYISVGSTCNACDETSPENATLLRAKPDGSSRSIFASGLRNTIGFGWDPSSGRLYGADHGTDWLGDEEQQEEFNLIEQGTKYGWPYVYDFSNFNPQDAPPEGISLEQWAAQSREPELGYTAHAAPMQMVFHSGTSFPEEYRGDAFIAMRGSWNRRPPSGYEVTRLDFQDGEPASWDHFAEGFLIETEAGGYGFLSRLAGIAEDRDGSLLLADDANGIIWRISYSGEAGAGETAETASVPNLVPDPRTDDLAMAKFDAGAGISVSSESFAAGEAIPFSHAAEGHDASPPLSWADAPEEAASFVLIAEDPDAAEPKPFVHWIVYDIPADTTSLAEGRPTAPVLPDPEGAKQGTNSRGQIGYHGPRPPREDGPHSYHFQIFALDVDQLGPEPGATREEVLSAMEGHVIAAGELTGSYERPAPEEAQGN